MHAIADTKTLVEESVITADQAREIEARARQTMVALAINAVLTAGIIAATGGFILWLADPLSVAVLGSLMLIGGVVILGLRTQTLRMFGNAAALIGAGMLIGGAAVELIQNHDDIAGWTMLVVGLAIVLALVPAYLRNWLSNHFVAGSILLMGLALHVTGLFLLVALNEVIGPTKSLAYLYAAAGIGLAGWFVDVRLVTALAIVPFAQALEAGTGYFHAAYVFYSSETTLSILQMGLLIGAVLWVASRWPERVARHARVLAVMAFIVANLCALVGSLFGDVVGETLFGPLYHGRPDGMSWGDWRDMIEEYRQTAFTIPEHAYSILWAVALAAMIGWAAFKANRGLFNVALTFAAIHAYTQLFETFGDEPLAYVTGGLVAIPLAWAMWRLDHWLTGNAPRTRP